MSVAFSRPFFGREEEEAAAAVIRSGWVVGGPKLAEFEQRVAGIAECEHAIGVSSWTTGAFLALKALGIGPGDEVIVPSLTFIASVNVIAHAGAAPVFADVEPGTFNIDWRDIEHRITPHTRAILPVDQLGMPCEIDRILDIAARHGLLVIQDAACAFASRFRNRPVGALAPLTLFSLHARKVITTAEGGIIVTNDGELAARLKRLRHQGMSLSDFERHGAAPTTFETYPEIGYNFRITDVQAAIGLCQLDRLDDLLARRRDIAERYIAGLGSLGWMDMPFVPAHVTPNWQSFQVRIRPDGPVVRNDLMQWLHERGIATRRGVMASHREAPYRDLNAHLPQTERAADECLQLPMYAGMSEGDIDSVIAALRQVPQSAAHVADKVAR